MIRNTLKRTMTYVAPVLSWTVIAALIGLCGGLCGVLFHKSVERVTAFRLQYPLIVCLLPLGGMLIILLYRRCKVGCSVGTNEILDAVRTDHEPPMLLMPLIFISTVITHLFGGSAGREGAALQLGGVIGDGVGHLLHLDHKDLHLAVMCGMSAVFSALFGAPLTAAIFAIEVVSVGVVYCAALLPCLAASFTAYGIASFCGVSPVRFVIPQIPKVTLSSVAAAAALTALCALLSVIFCIVIHRAHHGLQKLFPNEYLRIAACGAVIAGLSLFPALREYNGAGMEVVSRAISGSARSEAFLLKLFFTAVTIGAGYKGGEIVPTFFVGATFGCVVGPLLGLPAGFAAALALCAIFCGVVNCPIASAFLAIELFGGEAIPFFFMACCLSYALSGYYGLYSSQKILYSKLKLEYINTSAK